MKRINLGEYEHDNVTRKREDDLPEAIWRLPPEESMSDWKISITRTTTSSPAATSSSNKTRQSKKQKKQRKESEQEDEKTLLETYHVHKLSMSVGKRRSEYFAALFRRTDVIEAANTESQIELGEKAFDAFPLMLDFIYAGPDSCPLKTANAAVLRHLASYFGIPALFKYTKEFIQANLNIRTLPHYLIDAYRFGDDKLLGPLIERFAGNFYRMPRVHIPPPLFKDIVTSPHFCCGDSLLYSTCVETVCRESNPEEITSDLLESITDEKLMPLVCEVIALSLLKFSLAFSLPRHSEDNKKTLYERCIQAAALNWNDATKQLDKFVFPLDVKTDIMKAALDRASFENRRTRKERDDAVKKYEEGKKRRCERCKYNPAEHIFSRAMLARNEP